MRDETRTATPPQKIGLIRIKRETQPTRCLHCDRDVYWVYPRPGDYKCIPVSVNVEAHPGCKLPTNDEDGAGVHHTHDCPYLQSLKRRM